MDIHFPYIYLNSNFQRHMSWSLFILCSMYWCERWLFVLLILVELLTITV